MTIQDTRELIIKYIAEKKELQESLLMFIEDEDDEETSFKDLIQKIESQHLEENREEFIQFLYLLLEVANNHHRLPDFHKRIERILLQYKDKIKQNMTNIEIFNFFKKNKIVLLILIQRKILIIDQDITNIIMSLSLPQYDTYIGYFFNEISEFIEEGIREEIKSEILEKNPSFFTNLDEKRLKGENDNYICQLIREDLIEDFIIYVTKKSIGLRSLIDPSLFETNRLLLKKPIELIEYAAFYGSIQIFKYLQIQGNIELQPSLWLYTIHSENADLIHLLEEQRVEEFKIYFKAVRESIKCHHTNISEYLFNNYFIQHYSRFMTNSRIQRSYVDYSFRYHNYRYFPSHLLSNNVFNYLCKFGYLKIVKLLLSVEDQGQCTYKISILISIINQISTFY